MKKNILVGIVVALALMMVTSAAFAGPGWGRGGMGYGLGYGYPPLSSLTPEQSSKIQAIRLANFNESQPLQRQLFAKKTELGSLWLSQNPDQAKISALQKDILNIQMKLLEKATKTKLETRKVLTPEQLSQVSLYSPGMGYGKARMGGHMGRW